MFVTGATDTGKSSLARALFLSLRGPSLVIDPQDSSVTAVPGAVTFRDPRQVPEAAIARFVPRDPSDLAAYDLVYRWAFEHFPRYVWCDEAGIVLPAQGSPRAGVTYVVQGRKRMCGHLACHTRPREVNRNLIAQSRHVLVFDLPNPDDRRHIAEIAGIPPALLEAELAALAEHGFLWWSQRGRTLTACPPLEL